MITSVLFALPSYGIPIIIALLAAVLIKLAAQLVARRAAAKSLPLAPADGSWLSHGRAAQHTFHAVCLRPHH